MSGFVRTIEKRILKKMGYTRQTQKVETINGRPQIVHLRKGEGNIINPEGDAVGRHYPHLARGATRIDRTRAAVAA